MMDNRNTATDDLPYRPCVGMVLCNDDGLIFAGERIDTPGAWQMPQGGIDADETLENAIIRELREEIGTDKAKIVKILDEKIRYDLPPHLLGRLWNGQYRGQEQTWVFLRFTGVDSDINLNAHEPAEFAQWKWMTPSDLLDAIVPFKKEVYRKILACL